MHYSGTEYQLLLVGHGPSFHRAVLLNSQLRISPWMVLAPACQGWRVHAKVVRFLSFTAGFVASFQH
jgi:hypothetical protein